MISTRGLITDQWLTDAGDLASSGVDEMVAERPQRDRRWGSSTSSTPPPTPATTPAIALTLALWLAALAAFKAQLPGQQAIAYVGSSGQMRDFHAALIANAGSAQIMGAGNNIFSAEVIDGYLGLYHGIHMFESANVAANDADNDVGGFVALSAGQPGSPRPSAPASRSPCGAASRRAASTPRTATASTPRPRRASGSPAPPSGSSAA
jgi:hypothetical protein